jgi:integrating conjugative element protein (TIGR03761 family)
MTQPNKPGFKKDSIKAHLITDSEIALHTKTAVNLFNGEWQPGRMGLRQFAKLVSYARKAASEGDPYAEWYLYKTHEALFNRREQLTVMEDELQVKLNSLRGLKVGMFNNPAPFRYPLNFSMPHSFMAAILIESVDYLTRMVYTLYRVGVAVENQWTADRLMHHTQKLFALLAQWKYTGVTRKDITEQNQKAKLAESAFGKLPPAVFKREIRSTYLPHREGETHAENN